MKDCFKMSGKCRYQGEDGNCYQMEITTRERTPYFTCKYQTEDVLEEEKAKANAEIERIIKETPTDYVWIRLGYGLYQCSNCCWDFAGAVKRMKDCPHCKVKMIGAV